MKIKTIIIISQIYALLMLNGCANCFYTPRESETLNIDSNISNRSLLDTIGDTVNKSLSHDQSKNPIFTSAWGYADATEFNVKEGLIIINDFHNHSHAGYSAKIKRTSPQTLKVTIKGIGPYCSDMAHENELKKLIRLLSHDLNNSTSLRGTE